MKHHPPLVHLGGSDEHLKTSENEAESVCRGRNYQQLRVVVFFCCFVLCCLVFPLIVVTTFQLCLRFVASCLLKISTEFVSQFRTFFICS